MKPIDRFFVVLFICVLCLGIAVIAEEITLTTYYPAPYGAYEELTTTSNTYLATDSGNVGIGTTGPGAKLDVGGDIRINYSGTPQLKIQKPGITEWEIANNGDLEFRQDNGAAKLTIQSATGNVGIGITDPDAALHVNGTIKASFASGSGPKTLYYNSGTNTITYNDLAELFDATEEVEIGDVLVIDEISDLKLKKSAKPYEKGIAGIVSGSPAILFEGSSLEVAPSPGGFTKGNKPPVALVGRVPCKVSTENGPIERGDLLTSSSTPGHAMKATDKDKSFGAIVGKALEPFSAGPGGEETGKITVLVTLQ